MFGAAAYAEDSAGGSRKITGSLKVGQIKAGQLSDLFFAAPAVSGHPVCVIDEGGTAGVVPVADDWDTGQTNITDMGVDSAVDGFPMTRVTTVANNGEYEVNEATGIYSFKTANPRAAAVRPSYRYTTTGGNTYEMGNPLIGTIADMELVLWKPRFTKNMGIILYHAVMTSLDLPAKREEYTEATLNFSCFVDPAKQSPGQIFTSDPD